MKDTVNRVLTYTRPYRGRLVLGFAGALLYVLFTLLGPVFIGRAIDCAVAPGQVDYAGVLRWLLALGVCVLLAAGCQWVMNVCVRRVSADAANDMRRQAFVKINRVPLSYIDGHTHGDIISRMVNDAEWVSEGLLQGLTQLLPGVATILGTLAVMLVLNPFIALVVVLVTPVSIWYAGFIAKKSARYFKKQSDAQGRLSGFVNEMVSGQDVVTAFGYEERCYAAFDAISDELYDSGLKSTFYSSMTNPGTRFVNAAVYAAVAVFGAVNGCVIAFLKVPPFIATLGMQTIVYGLCSVLTDNQPMGGYKESYTNVANGSLFTIGDFKFPFLALIAVAVGVYMWFLYNKTRHGKYMYAIGGNENAAQVAGVNVPATLIRIYVLASVMYALGGFLLGAKAGGASTATGFGYELEAIAACTIGGVSTNGGVGKVSGVLIGVMVFEVLKICLQFMGVDPAYTFIVQGLVIIVAVALDLRKYLAKK